jgi:superfamily I DNA/RNA helicase
MVVMSDPAQNIYNKQVLGGFIGKPPVLKQTYRLRGRIASASRLWLEEMNGNLETVPEYQPSLLGEMYWLNGRNESAIAESVVKLVKSRQGTGVQWADIAVITTNRRVARNIADVLIASGIPTQPTVAFNEEYENIARNCTQKHEVVVERLKRDRAVKICIQRQIRDIEQPRKLEFGRKNGRLKLSTIHSFKGWEWPHVILVLSGSDEARDNRNELIYTGLTRPLQSLCVINCMAEIDRFRDVLDHEGLLAD